MEPKNLLTKPYYQLTIDTILEDASDNADYGSGAMFETTYCLNCGYIWHKR